MRTGCGIDVSCLRLAVLLKLMPHSPGVDVFGNQHCSIRGDGQEVAEESSEGACGHLCCQYQQHCGTGCPGEHVMKSQKSGGNFVGYNICNFVESISALNASLKGNPGGILANISHAQRPGENSPSILQFLSIIMELMTLACRS